MKKLIVVIIIAVVVIYLLRMKKAATQGVRPAPVNSNGLTLSAPAPLNGSASVNLQASNLGLTPQIVIQPAPYQDIQPAFSGTTAGNAYAMLG